jgi:riboflavin kinase / FMN adenylyltransferase
MHTIRYPSHTRTPCRGAVVALGNFDGMHVGHRAILAHARDIARSASRPLAVMTFEPHPREFLAKQPAYLRIFSLREKLSTLAGLQLDTLFLMRFNQQLAATSAEDFIEHMLVQQLGVTHLVTGDNFYFGKGRQGNKTLLQEKASQLGFGYTALPPVLADDGQIVSSSTIRTLLSEGNIEKANSLLGSQYRIGGRVILGQQRGRTIGVPTANIALGNLYRPRFGVYAVQVQLEGEENKRAGVANLGVKPTMGEHAPLLEVHLFDYDGDLYGKQLRVFFSRFIRPEQKFADFTALTTQIQADIKAARQHLGQH